LKRRGRRFGGASARPDDNYARSILAILPYALGHIEEENQDQIASLEQQREQQEGGSRGEEGTKGRAGET
jgi:hypothetical protein